MSGPPSAEEQDLYYYGLPSLPKLIARSSSSTQIWTNPQKPGWSAWTGTCNMYRKMLQPAGKHPLLQQLWNDATSSLRVQIIDAVSDMDWHAVDILRVGFLHMGSPPPITLMVAVTPDTVSWSKGHAIALQCRAILEQHAIHDIHCEIRESVVRFLTEPASTKPASNDETKPTLQLSFGFPDAISAEHEYGETYAQLTDCLGTRIATKDMPNMVGTKGLYLSLPPPYPHGKSRLVALTCRHVVTHSGIEAEPLRDIIQIDQPTFEKELERCKRTTAYYDTKADSYSKRGQADVAAACIESKNSAEALARAMEPFKAASSRVIGQLLYSPESSCATTGAEWLRDWALIELQPTSHQAPLDCIKNRVLIPEYQFWRLVQRGESGWKGLANRPRHPPLIAGCLELLKEVVPYRELLNPSEYSDELAMCVAKYGASSDLTMGLGNTLKSVIRTTERKIISEEWAITSVLRSKDQLPSFSEPGDSGSCIWDMKGRPAGILMAGNGSGLDDMHDVTYATPLELLLEDIRSHGFDVSLV